MRSDHRAWVGIDLGALKINALMLAERAGVPLLPMVKSDAYGLGVREVVPVLETVGPWGYGVATVREGAELRDLGITRPVLVFTPILPEDFEEIRRQRLTPTFGDSERIFLWHLSGGGPWHLAIDTGMNRAGVPWRRVAELRDDLLIEPPEGAFTHFHSADANDGSMEVQQQRFRDAIAALPSRPKYLHAENSPAILRQSPSPWDFVRPGVALYGVTEGSGASATPNAVASFGARIVDVRQLDDTETCSYGATWRATGPRRIATVSAGYADGIRRSLSNKGMALVHGTFVPIVGVVTMDMTMLDVTGVDCRVGDAATFLGRDGAAELTIAEVSEHCGLSQYELLVGLRLRAARVYKAPTW